MSELGAGGGESAGQPAGVAGTGAGGDVLVYLYGITRADAEDPPGELFGIEAGTPRLLRTGTIAGIVSEVSADAYGEDALNSRLDDLDWVGARGMEHERVLDWYAERGAVLPLSLFSIHRSEAGVLRKLAEAEEEFHRLLDRLHGRREWGIKLWRREAESVDGIDRLSSALRELSRQIEEAPPGKRFLLEKKRTTLRTEEVRVLSGRLAHELFGALRGAADAAVSVPLPAGVAGAGRTLLLHAAYLVPEEGFARFQQEVNEQAARLSGSGFEIEFTGPWPPYHFTDADDD